MAVLSDTEDILRISNAGRTTHATVENRLDIPDYMAAQVRLVATMVAKAVRTSTRGTLRIANAERTTYAMVEDRSDILDCTAAPVAMVEEELMEGKTNCLE